MTTNSSPDRFPCPECLRDGIRVETTTHRTHVITHLRCPACGHKWTVERVRKSQDDKEKG